MQIFYWDKYSGTTLHSPPLLGACLLCVIPFAIFMMDEMVVSLLGVKVLTPILAVMYQKYQVRCSDLIQHLPLDISFSHSARKISPICPYRLVAIDPIVGSD